MKLKDAVLNSPQGTQGGDLGLGQASDARDSEPLIGPVAAQRAQVSPRIPVIFRRSLPQVLPGLAGWFSELP